MNKPLATMRSADHTHVRVTVEVLDSSLQRVGPPAVFRQWEIEPNGRLRGSDLGLAIQKALKEAVDRANATEQP